GNDLGQNTSEITELNSGIYLAEITDANGCKIITDTFEILLETSIRGSQNHFPFTLYPNPVSSELLISGDWSKAKSISVSDISGRIINSQKLDNANTIQKL